MKAFLEKVKAFFAKVWKWSLANKAIAIGTAAVVVAGAACAIVLPIALHEHSYSTEWTTDATNHWHVATCKHEDEISDLAAHTYDNACDTTCNDCGYERTVGAHVYDNACDADCNVCTETRTPAEHVYDNACDTDCNECGATRTITHDHADTLTAGETTHWYACSVCGDKKDEAAHAYTLETANADTLKTAATATTKAVYYKSCVCGAIATTDEFTFETDKTVATLANIQDLSKTYDKVELANPTYETNSDGAVTIEWYQGNTKLDAKPVNAGTYKVKVIIAESATFTGVSGEQEFTIAKVVVTIPTLEKMYDGNGEFEFVFEGPADAEIDCLVDIGKTNKNVGTYTDVAITYKSASSENYEITATTVSATIVKCAIWATDVEFTYTGVNAFYGDEAVADVEFENDVLGEMNPADIVFEFSGSGVGNTLTNVKFDDGIPHAQNYTFDLSKCTASITPRTINDLKYDFVYDASDYFQVELTNADHSDILADDSVLFDVLFASENVGAAVLTDGEMAPSLLMITTCLVRTSWLSFIEKSKYLRQRLLNT